MPRHLKVAFCGWLLAAVLVPVDIAVAQDQKQVLVLYSNRRDAQIVAVGDRELPRILNDGHPNGVDYYSEVIDQVRLSRTDYVTAFGDFLRLKYGSHRFDLVIAMDDSTIEFLDQVRDELFPATPIVFFSTRSSPRRVPNSTGVTAELNLASSLELAVQLQPDLRHVFVVSGAEAANRVNVGMAREQFRSFEPRLEFTYLTGLPTEELERRLASLPAHSVVYFLVVYRDGQDENFEPLAYLRRVAEVAAAPTYCWVDSAMDQGIVGGSLRSQPAQVEAVGALALRVLRGEPADSIPIAQADLNVAQVDWRQLRRWNISEARVPAGTRILFREPTRLGSLPVLHPGCARSADRADRVDRRPAGSAIEAAASRGTSRRQPGEAARELRPDLRSWRPPHQAQEDERARIARELHDDLGQQVALVAADLAEGGRPRRAVCPRRAWPRARPRQERARSVAPSAPGEAAPGRAADRRSPAFSTSSRARV